MFKLRMLPQACREIDNGYIDFAWPSEKEFREIANGQRVGLKSLELWGQDNSRF